MLYGCNPFSLFGPTNLVSPGFLRSKIHGFVAQVDSVRAHQLGRPDFFWREDSRIHATNPGHRLTDIAATRRRWNNVLECQKGGFSLNSGP